MRQRRSKQLAFKFGPLEPLTDLLFDEPEAGREVRPAEEREHEPEAFWNGKIWVTSDDLPF